MTFSSDEQVDTGVRGFNNISSHGQVSTDGRVIINIL